MNTLKMITTKKAQATLENMSKDKLEAINKFGFIFENVNSNNTPYLWEVWEDVFEDFVLGFDKGWNAEKSHPDLDTSTRFRDISFFTHGHYLACLLNAGGYETRRKSEIMSLMYDISELDIPGSEAMALARQAREGRS